MAKLGINKVILIGFLGKNPELKYLQNGKPICTFTLGTNEAYKTKEGEQKEKTEWHNIAFFGRLAEIAGEYLAKGSEVYVEGSIRAEKWEDKEGINRQTTKIMGSVLRMVGEKKKRKEREPGDEEEEPK